MAQIRRSTFVGKLPVYEPARPHDPNQPPEDWLTEQMAHDPWVMRNARKARGARAGNWATNTMCRPMSRIRRRARSNTSPKAASWATPDPARRRPPTDDAAPLRFAQRGCQLKDDRSCDRVAAAERATNSEPALDRRCRSGEKKACDALAQLQREAYQAGVAQCKAAQRNRQLGSSDNSDLCWLN